MLLYEKRGQATGIAIISLFLIIIFAVIFLFYNNINYTGATIGLESEEIRYTEKINTEFSQDKEYSILLGKDCENKMCKISDIAINGYAQINASDNIKLKLESENNNYLLLNKEINLEQEKIMENITFEEEIQIVNETTNETITLLESKTKEQEKIIESAQTIVFENECGEICKIEIENGEYNLIAELSENNTIYVSNLSYALQIATKDDVMKEEINETTDIIIPEVITEQQEGVVGQPVMWKVKLKSQTQLEIPEEAFNITIQKGKIKKSDETTTKISAYTTKTKNKIIELEAGQESDEIIYYTEAPQKTEIVEENKKIIKIISPNNTHYTNVTAYTNIYDDYKIINPDVIKIYWVEENKYINIKNVEDTNNDNYIDYIEWIVPHLSEQTFEITIKITDALHLDSNKIFISNIYNSVKDLDNLWSETIHNKEYVRVTFESNLTSNNDITVFPRIVSGNPIIEVYEKDENDLIASFDNLINNEYNKFYLTNLQNSQDTFDLKILGGSVEFDHIIDPQVDQFFEDCVDLTDWSLNPSNGWAPTANSCTSSNGAGEIMLRQIDLSEKTNTLLKFTWEASKIDAGEFFRVYAGTSDATMVIVFQIEGNGGTQSGSKEINLTGNESSTTTIQAWCSSGGGESCTWDEINLTSFVTSDETSPLVTINFPTNITYTTLPLNFNVTLNENGSVVYYTLDNWITNISMTTTDNREYNATNTSIANGQYTFRVFANDSLNNINTTQSVIFSFEAPTNNPPTNVTLIAPTAGDITLTNRTVTFQWFNSTDLDNDPISYNLLVDDVSGFTSPIINITLPNTSGANNVTYYSTTELNVDTPYYWKIYANDSTTNGTDSEVRSFTVASTVIISLTVGNINFGELVVGTTINTSNPAYPPIIIKNDGNTYIDANISATKQLWEMAIMPTSNFMYRIDNVTGQEGAFNWDDSVTAYTPIPLTNNTAIRQLNYSTSKNSANLHIEITAPTDEPAGNKSSILQITGWASA